MNPKDLAKIERWNYVIAGALIVLSAILFDTRMTLGVAVGAVLACGNFTGMRFLVASSLRAQGMKKVVLQLILVFKMGVLFLLIFLAMKFLPLNAIGLAVGMSVFLLSIGVESVRFALLGRSPKDPESNEAHDGRA
jgi:hypothetical protein